MAWALGLALAGAQPRPASAAQVVRKPSGTMPTFGAVTTPQPQLSPDGPYVVYVADQATDGAEELWGASLTVTTTADDVDVNGNCTLREAIIAANTDTAVDACPAGNGADTLNLPAGNYVLTVPGAGETAGLTGDLNIEGDLTLIGAGWSSTIIDANGLDRVLGVSESNAVTISGVTITGGNSDFRAGSGILVSSGALTLTHSSVSGNLPHAGIWLNRSSFTLIDSRVEGNAGGGLRVNLNASALVLNSTIANNSGGGIHNLSTLTLVNSTVSGNSTPSDGGGILSAGTTHLYNATLTNNTADSDGSGNGDGGGVSVITGTLTARNTLIAGNLDNSGVGGQRPDCFGTLTGQGYNLIENTTGCTFAGITTGNLTGVSPDVDPLQDNGGPTLTHALLAGSPAVNAGDPAGCSDYTGAGLDTDQRGYARPADGVGNAGGVCDIGAYEFNAPAPPPSLFTLYLPLIQN